MTFNLYIVPAVLSVLVIWSLRSYLNNKNLAMKAMTSFIISVSVILIYNFSHSFINNGPVINIDNYFLTGAVVICLLNMAALWVFTKNIKLRD